MTIIKILLIAAALGLLVLLVRNHGTNRASALTKIWLTLFLLFAIYAVIRPGDVSWVAAQLGLAGALTWSCTCWSSPSVISASSPTCGSRSCS